MVFYTLIYLIIQSEIPLMDIPPIIQESGTQVVDALIPTGRGQRELILGDRNYWKNNDCNRML